MRKWIDFKNVDKLIADLEAEAGNCRNNTELCLTLEDLRRFFRLTVHVQILPMYCRLIYWRMAYIIYKYLRFKHQLDDNKKIFDLEVIDTFDYAIRKVYEKLCRTK